MAKVLLFVISVWSSVAFGGVPQEVTDSMAARKFIMQPEHEAGYELGEVCKKLRMDKKNPKLVCRTVIKEFGVMLAVKQGKTFQAILVDGKSCESLTEGFHVDCIVDRRGMTNGVNTEFVVNAPKGLKVYAIRRYVRAGKGYKEVAYTPFAEALNTPAIRKSGVEYLKGMIEAAKAELNSKGVMSTSSPGMRASDRVPSEVIFRIATIEHIDHGRFAREEFAGLAQESAVIYALNRDGAYKHSVSSANARGALQFTKKTYASLLKQYPKAGLTPDFIKGTENISNILKAAILLADSDLGNFPKDVRQVLFTKPLLMEEAIAGCYNGGCSRIKKILIKGGDLVTNNPNPENKIYIAKLRALRNLPKFILIG